jgi:hypothetical protein
MSADTATLQQVYAGLQAEGLLPEDSTEKIEEILNSMAEIQPWYVRTMVGFGAWLASLLLIGFVGGIGIAADGGFVVIGVGLIAGAIFVRRKSVNDFLVQSALACSLAGQAIMAYGIVEITSGNELEEVLSVVAVISTILFFIFPDRIHRVLSVLITTTSLSVLLYIWELNMIVPVLGPVFAAVLVVMYTRQGVIIESGKGHLLRPLMTGMMLSAFGFLLLSTIYILPELRLDFEFYPRPWISTLLLGALFLYGGTRVWSQLSDDRNSSAAGLFYGLLVLVIATAWAIPGLLLALIVIMLGTSSGNRIFIGAGITFLVVFIASYFYGIQISMLTKSITLVATGSAVLLARWLILNMIQNPGKGKTSHA